MYSPTLLLVGILVALTLTAFTTTQQFTLAEIQPVMEEEYTFMEFLLEEIDLLKAEIEWLISENERLIQELADVSNLKTHIIIEEQNTEINLLKEFLILESNKTSSILTDYEIWKLNLDHNNERIKALSNIESNFTSVDETTLQIFINGQTDTLQVSGMENPIKAGTHNILFVYDMIPIQDLDEESYGEPVSFGMVNFTSIYDRQDFPRFTLGYVGVVDMYVPHLWFYDRHNLEGDLYHESFSLSTEGLYVWSIESNTDIRHSGTITVIELPPLYVIDES